MQAAGTAGELHFDLVVAYLERLTGAAPALDEPLKVRSVHRAALAAWARKQNVPLRLSAIGSGASFTVRDLLGASDTDATQPRLVEPRAVTSPVASAGAESGAFTGIGIDIEEVENLPDAADYREHPFFQDNFTPAEIAYCLRQADARASFCGTWAAKEAIFKAGASPASSASLGNIEIRRDISGKPIYDRCRLSISHTTKMAVAVCVLVAPVAKAESKPGVDPDATLDIKADPDTGKRRRWPWSRS